MNLRKISGKEIFFWLIRHPEKVLKKIRSIALSFMTLRQNHYLLLISYIGQQHYSFLSILMYLHVTYKQHGASRDRPFIAKTPYPCDL